MVYQMLRFHRTLKNHINSELQPHINQTRTPKSTTYPKHTLNVNSNITLHPNHAANDQTQHNSKTNLNHSPHHGIILTVHMLRSSRP